MGPKGDEPIGGLRSISVQRRWRVLLAVIVACSLVVSAAAAGTIGSPVGTASADDDARVDVVFVFDRSDSMDSDRYSMALEMEAIDDRLQERNVDVRYTLLTYVGDSTREEQGWTGNYGEVDEAMDFGTSGDVERASDAILEATSMDFRDDAERVVVLVTDEDDDSSDARREEATNALSSSGVTFVTVAPDDPSVSSCEYHSPPCDEAGAADAGENELSRIADNVGGTSIDIGDPADSIVDDVGAEIETAATGSSSGGFGKVATSGDNSDLQVTNLTVNRSSAYVGEPVAVEATVENAGGSAGTFDALFADETGLIETRRVEVPPGTVRTVRFNQTYHEPDQYELFLTHQYAGQVEVTQRPDTAVETRELSDGDGIVANVTEPRANTSVAIPLDDVDGPRGDVVTLDALTLTPADDEDFSVEVLARPSAPNGTPELPENVRAVTYLTATTDATLADGANDTAAFEYAAAVDEAGLYHYEPNGSGWTALEAEPTNGSSDSARLVATSPGLSHFAVGVGEASFEVADLEVASTSVEAGEPIEATATVENDGAAGGTYAATLVADGEVVDRTEVSVPAGETRRVDFTFVPSAVGDVQLSAEEGSEDSIGVQVESNDQDGNASNATTEPGTTGSDGQPGFGAGIVVVALLATALLAIRRG